MCFVIIAPSLTPTDVTVMATTSSSISFYWKSPPAYAINGIIRSYYLTLTEENTGKHLHITAKSPPQIFEVLHSFYNYTLQIAAFTVEVGPYSDPVTVTTLEDCKCTFTYMYIIQAIWTAATIIPVF